MDYCRFTHLLSVRIPDGSRILTLMDKAHVEDSYKISISTSKTLQAYEYFGACSLFIIHFLSSYILDSLLKLSPIDQIQTVTTPWVYTKLACFQADQQCCACNANILYVNLLSRSTISAATLSMLARRFSRGGCVEKNPASPLRIEPGPRAGASAPASTWKNRCWKLRFVRYGRKTGCFWTSSLNCTTGTKTTISTAQKSPIIIHSNRIMVSLHNSTSRQGVVSEVF
jgi:hypothetical protein